jgi:hypothetical protein
VREILTTAQPFGSYVPERVLAQFNTVPISAAEQADRVLWDAPTRVDRVKKLWRIGARRACQPNAVRGAFAFPTFLQHWWGLDSVAELAPRAMSAVRQAPAV